MTEVEKGHNGKYKTGLIVACIIVIVLAISNVWTYMSLQNQADSLQGQVNTLHNEKNYWHQEYLAMMDIVNLNKQTVLLDHKIVNHPANYYTHWIYSLGYAGYLTITIHSSTTTNAYAKVVYGYKGTTWVLSKTLGVSGSATFPILPSATSIEVGIGNTNWLDSATHDVSVVYHY